MTNLKQKRFVDTDYLDQQLDITMQSVEGSDLHINDSKMGYISDIEILGNTVQDSNDLQNIKSVGTKIEGQELYEIPLICSNENLFDKRQPFNQAFGRPEYDKSVKYDFENDLLVTQGQHGVASSSSQKHKLKPNTTYSFYAESVGTTHRIGIKDNGEYLGESSADTQHIVKYTFTTTTGDVRITYIRANENPTGLYGLKNISLVEGDTPKKVAREEDKLTILSPVQLEKVGDIADRIICKDGVWGVEKNIVEYVFSGNEIRYTQGTKDGVLLSYWLDCNTILKNKLNTTVVINSKLPYGPGGLSNNGTPAISFNSNCQNLLVDTYNTTLDEVNNYMKGSILKYVSVQPQFIPLPHDQQIKLRTYKDFTRVSFDCEVEGTIKAKVPMSIGASLESLADKAESTDKRINELETVSAKDKAICVMDKDYFNAPNTIEGRINEISIEGKTVRNVCTNPILALSTNGHISLQGEYVSHSSGHSGHLDVLPQGLTLNTFFLNDVSVRGNKYTITKRWQDAKIRAKKGTLGDKIYYRVNLKVDSYDTNINAPINVVTYSSHGGGYGRYHAELKDLDTRFSHDIGFIRPIESTSTNYEYCVSIGWNRDIEIETNGSPVCEFTLNDYVAYNLTELFGAGNEPSLEWCDSYLPYISKTTSVGQQEDGKHKFKLVSTNKNLFDVNMLDKENLWEEETGTSYRSFRLNLKPNTKYTCYVPDNPGYQGGCYACITKQPNSYYSVYNWIFHNDTQAINYSTYHFTTDSNPVYFTFVYNEDTFAKLKELSSNILIEEGHNFTPTFTTHTKAEREILLSEPLRGIANVAQDRIVKLEDNNYYIERHFIELLLDGVDNDVIRYTEGAFPDTGVKYVNVGFVDSFRYIDTVTRRALWDYPEPIPFGINPYAHNTKGVCTVNNNLRIRLEDGVDTTIETLKNKPIRIVCQLNVPRYEKLTDYDCLLYAYPNNNSIFSTNTIVKPNLKVENYGMGCYLAPSTTYTVAFEDVNIKDDRVVTQVQLGGSQLISTTKNYAVITTPSTIDDKTLRISRTPGEVITNIRVLEGDHSKNVPSHFKGLKSAFGDTFESENYRMELTSNNGNILNVNSRTPVFDGMNFLRNTKQVNNYISENGDWEVVDHNSSHAGRGPIVRLEQGKTYRLSATLKQLGEVTGAYLQVGTDATFYWKRLNCTEVGKRYSLTFTSGRGSEYVIINPSISSGSITTLGEKPIFSDMRLEEVGHEEQVKTITDKLVAHLPQPLSSLPNGVKDKVTIKNGKLVIERNTKTVVLDGNSETHVYTVHGNDWTDNRKSIVAYSVELDDGLFNWYTLDEKCVSIHTMSDKFTFRCKNEYVNNNPNKLIGIGQDTTSDKTGHKLVMVIPKHWLESDTLDSFKKWLKENPLTVTYQRREPIVEEINMEGYIKSYDKSTYVDTNSIIAPQNMTFNISNHLNNKVADLEQQVSDLTSWKNEVFESVNHEKTFSDCHTNILDTKRGMVNEVKLQGKTLVNLMTGYETKLYRCTTSYPHTQTFPSVIRASTTEVGAGMFLRVPKLTKERIVGKRVTFHVRGLKSGSGQSSLKIYNRTLEKTYHSVNFSSTSANYTMVVDIPNDFNPNDTLEILVYVQQNTYSELDSTILLFEGDMSNEIPVTPFNGVLSVGQETDKLVMCTTNKNIFDISDFAKFMDLPYSNGELQINNGSSKTYPIYVPNKYVATYITTLSNTNGSATLNYLYDSKIHGYEAMHGESTNRRLNYLNKGNVLGLRVEKWGSQVNIKDFMISSSTPLEYVPHENSKVDIKYFNPSTQSWETPILREWDSIEKHSNGKYYYHKRSDEIVLDGTIEKIWSYNTTTNGIKNWYCGIIKDRVKPASDIICDTLKPVTISQHIKGIRVGETKNITILLNESDISSNNLNEWLLLNPTTLVYQLAEEEVYECNMIELNSYEDETNVFISSGSINPITHMKLTSNLPQIADNLRSRIKLLEKEIYDYKVTQNLRQLRTTYRSDYANFGVATVREVFTTPTSLEITPYALDLFELFKSIIEQGKECYDRIELEEYIDFYIMTFIFDFDMAFELFDLIEEQHQDIEIEDLPQEDVEVEEM